ncbi:hypothetical protein TA3x_002835 [Tundrisphaera sp. TA3]|uniref:hypothetical protein n=1 Tax=Tundrisphaera sp. TA3 TaxID=3435775 RepID=UPI003EBE3637
MNAPRLESDVPARPGLMQGAWKRAKRFGFFASFLGVPFIAIGLVGGLAFSAFLFGAGRGYWIFRLPINLIGLGGGFITFWMVVGAAWGMVAGLLDRTRPDSRLGAGWSLANRPISLPFRRAKKKAAPDHAAELPPVRRMPVWPWLLLIPFLGLLVVAGLFGRYVDNRLEKRLEDAVNAADADDPNWRCDDLMAGRVPIPDDENGAIVVAEALENVPDTWPMDPGGPGQRPTDTAVSKVYDRSVEIEPNVLLDDEGVDTLRAELARLGDSVRIARTVADFDQGRHELEFAWNPLSTLLPETQRSRTAARLLVADAMIRAQDGDADGALDSCRAILGVARSIGDEPFSISQLVRIAIDTVAAQATVRVLGLGEPSDAALARLQAVALDEMAEPLFLYGMKGERAMLVEVIRKIRDGEMPIGALSGSAPDDDPSLRSPVSGWSQFYYDCQLATALEWMNETVAIARSPVLARPPLRDAWEAEFDRTRKSRLRSWFAVLPILLMPAVDASESAALRNQAQMGTLANLLAAERHRLRHGEWPESLAAIDREILPIPPLDPYTGKPFLLNRSDGRFIVHSIGPNLVDEDGAYEPKRSLRGGPDDIGSMAWDLPLRRQAAPE